ncbi:helicase-related protein [Cyanobium sp. NS01]|uniref:helicase-related protein n=1 Tax=Cyanobium sp. NS01 TaxID=261284 RepID=UPI0016441EC9|nr:helicase-related protein [Cyanobium sp. NS01]QNI70607.1 Highly putative restriction enzyme [Cyanobium sp. NS01]
MRALGFCVSVEHARWMARKFVAAGLRAAALDASSPRDESAEQIRRLRDGQLQILFAVDLFNEGLDIPEIDTVLFLRPTESAIVFLQQLGRGLRLCRGKSCLTVLGQKTQPASARPTAASASTSATAPCSAARATSCASRSKPASLPAGRLQPAARSGVQ